MSQRSLLASALIVVLAFPMAVLSDPPARPQPLTAGQYQQLVQLEHQPENRAVQDVQATYSSNAKFDHDYVRITNDVSTFAFLAGVPATIITLLICAAPY